MEENLSLRQAAPILLLSLFGCRDGKEIAKDVFLDTLVQIEKACPQAQMGIHLSKNAEAATVGDIDPYQAMTNVGGELISDSIPLPEFVNGGFPTPASIPSSRWSPSASPRDGDLFILTNDGQCGLAETVRRHNQTLEEADGGCVVKVSMDDAIVIGDPQRCSKDWVWQWPETPTEAMDSSSNAPCTIAQGVLPRDLSSHLRVTPVEMLTISRVVCEGQWYERI